MPPAGRVTIRDVAQAAGVRPSTVSKALNGGHGSAEVRRRVDDAAARLGYRPNQQARGLRRAETRSIGLLVPDLANPGFLPFLRGAQRAAEERGYVVLIADGRRSDTAAAAALGRFFDQGVDALLLAGPVPADSLGPYLDHGVPVAPSAADRAATHHWEHSEAAATAGMARRLLELGHRRFAFVTTPAPNGPGGGAYRRSRLDALATTLRQAGARLTVAVVDPAADIGLDLRQVTATGHPTALVCANHLLVPWLLRALDAGGIRLPTDASLVVYGDSDWAQAHLPALSVVSRDTGTDGYDLAAGLLDTLAGRPPTARTPGHSAYLERGSCGPAG